MYEAPRQQKDFLYYNEGERSRQIYLIKACTLRNIPSGKKTAIYARAVCQVDDILSAFPISSDVDAL
jgi:hypothetical protein